MKKVIVLICLIYCFTTYAAPQYVIKLGTKKEWAPYHINTPDGSDGVAVRMLACIMVRLNQPFEIHKKPWARVQFETKIGKLDGFFSASKNSERDSFALQTSTFIQQNKMFYIKKNNSNFDPKEHDLNYIRENLTVSARASSNGLTSLQKMKYNIIATPQTTAQLLRLLDLKRVDAIIENDEVFDNLLKNKNLSASNYHKILMERKDMGVYFGKHFTESRPKFIEKFNKNIAACQEPVAAIPTINPQ